MALALVLFVGMEAANKYLSVVAGVAVNTLLILVFFAYIAKKDFPLAQLPVVGKYFRKQ